MMENVSSIGIEKLGITISYWDLIGIGMLIIFVIGLALGIFLTYLFMDKKYLYLKDLGSYWRHSDDKKRQELLDDIKLIEDIADKTNLRIFKHCSDFLNFYLSKLKNRGEN